MESHIQLKPSKCLTCTKIFTKHYKDTRRKGETFQVVITHGGKEIFTIQKLDTAVMIMYHSQKMRSGLSGNVKHLLYRDQLKSIPKKVNSGHKSTIL